MKTLKDLKIGDTVILLENKSIQFLGTFISYKIPITGTVNSFKKAYELTTNFFDDKNEDKELDYVENPDYKFVGIKINSTKKEYTCLFAGKPDTTRLTMIGSELLAAMKLDDVCNDDYSAEKAYIDPNDDNLQKIIKIQQENINNHLDNAINEIVDVKNIVSKDLLINV